MKKILSVELLMERWKVAIKTVVDAISNGLPAYIIANASIDQISGFEDKDNSYSVCDAYLTSSRDLDDEFSLSLPIQLESISIEYIFGEMKKKGEYGISKIFFYEDEVIDYEIRNNFDRTNVMDAKEKRHYGLLKKQQEKFDDALVATAKALLYCQDQEKKGRTPIENSIFLSFMDENFSNLPERTKDKIWKAIKQTTGKKYLKGQGRPSKK